ncbi:unnamed protein product [Dibothriocephalus latus]|uniref:P-type ATPase C-terminal domain-containing protein n=1 Tax=Dibothriocephalus latus TaxID=60516 RepID=A0A3P6TSB1_DIBLA|nr:unnamed protein product [Dibothriocephalus latus]
MLLVHGQWNYYRVSMAALVFYFKCVAFVAVHSILLFFNGFSAQSMVEGLLYTLYNLTLTSWGPFCFALFEQHVLEKELLHRPYLYRLMTQNVNLRAWHIAVWCLDGIWHALVVVGVGYYVLAGGGVYAEARFYPPGTSYATIDMDLFGSAVYTLLVVTTNLRMLYTSGPASVLYLNFFYLDTSPAFWFSIPLSVVLALLPDILWRLASDAWWDHQIALSGVKREKERRKRKARREQPQDSWAKSKEEGGLVSFLLPTFWSVSCLCQPRQLCEQSSLSSQFLKTIARFLVVCSCAVRGIGIAGSSSLWLLIRGAMQKHGATGLKY